MVNATFETIEGEAVLIELQLDANPIPALDQFGWQFNGIELVSFGDVAVNLTYLDLGKVNRNEAGNYSVVANNIAGTGSANFQVIVYCKSLIKNNKLLSAFLTPGAPVHILI